jgi:hypothetical protein
MPQRGARLVFEASTPRYLASPQFKDFLLELIGHLPPKLQPTRCQSSSLGKKPVFSVQHPSALAWFLPGDTPFEGDVNLYSPRHSFELGVVWRCGDAAWFRSLEAKPFNNAFFCIADGTQVMADAVLLDLLIMLWVRLCEFAQAAYGFVYLENPSGGPRPRGEGHCLPRLHWRTYLGPEYSATLALKSVGPTVAVQVVGRGSLLEILAPPESWVLPNAEEYELIQALGSSFFWRESDSWRKPLGPYRMPEFDWSEIGNCEKKAF